MTDKEWIREAMGEITDKDLEPYYKTVYTADSMQLEDVSKLFIDTPINEWTALKILTNSCTELKADYMNYILDEHKSLTPDSTDRLSYTEAGHIGRFIIWKHVKNDTACFDKIFESSEVILKKGSESTQNLIVVGLFEAIQNIGGWHKVDYYSGFDKWLKPESKKAWDDLIRFWEKKK